MACESYSVDILTGGTATASTEAAPSYYDHYAVDDNDSTGWLSINSAEGKVPGTPQWWKYDLGEGNEAIVSKIRIESNPYSYLYPPTDFLIQGSNNDSDWDTLETVSGISSWAVSTWKEWEFTNTTAYRYYRIYITDGLGTGEDQVGFAEIEALVCLDVLFIGSISINSITSGIDLMGAEVHGESIDDIEISDNIDAWHDTGFVDDRIELSDDIDTIAEYGKGISEDIALTDWVNAFNSMDSIDGDIAVDDFMDFFIEIDSPVDGSNIEISDSIDCLNWSEWLRENEHISVKRFYFTLTGAADGETDIIIPISSFQARKRDGEPTYLSVTIPGMDYAGQIADRSNGQMIVEMAYFINGVEQIREEIIRVNLETIRIDQGARNRSINLSGHRSESFDGRVKDLSNPNYKYTINGKIRYRFPQVDPYLNPGDLCRVGTDEFLVNYITYSITANYRQMEVYEV